MRRDDPEIVIDQSLLEQKIKAGSELERKIVEILAQIIVADLIDKEKKDTHEQPDKMRHLCQV